MQQIGAVVSSIFVFLSSVVFTPKIAINEVRNVLGDFRVESPSAVKMHKDGDRIHRNNDEEESEDKDHDDSSDRLQLKRFYNKEKWSLEVEEAKRKRKKAKETVKERHEEFRQKRKEHRDEIKDRREEMRDKLKTIRDEKRKEIATRVCERFESLNSNLTEKFNNSLGRLEELLGKVESRRAKAEEKGYDVASCSEQISNAKSAIDQAYDAVGSQVENSYICEIADDASLGGSLSTTRKQLGDDLRSVHGRVKQARSGVRLAVRCLGKIRGVNSIEDHE